jgi:cyclopropane-fatty-acyl-phospholipid synthase
MADDTKTENRANTADRSIKNVTAGPESSIALGLLTSFIGKFVREGRIELTLKKNPPAVLGVGKSPPIAISINRTSSILKLLMHPDLAFGEAYVDRNLDIRDEDLVDFIGILLRNDALLEETRFIRGLNRVRTAFDEVFRVNTFRRSRNNASHHYDIGNDLYSSFLDDEMLYSCAFFQTEAQNLADAQINKLNISLDRLNVLPGSQVLDIGCGWGAVTRKIAGRDAFAVGITLSEQQLQLAIERVPEQHRNRIRYELCDYRDHALKNSLVYDRIISIGMFEHVGRAQFLEYFYSIRRMLKRDGRALIHSIVKKNASRTNDWINKYIFPGGSIPRVEDMVEAAESAGLKLVSAPFLHKSQNYARTLELWRERFNAAYPVLDHNRYDERFRRMWNFYLAGSQAAFEALNYEVAQIVVEYDATKTTLSRP